ncbi:transmembrane protein 268 [Paramormyrops kingsleyae]|uniref:Transmembrane protein 268-like n=1 Tax=Paramormyrops kingsleyae TaxID=1676925 RepID=A0A3B3SLM0_9TELE|nr:transmembrane protein 268-like [Paramormyrops kingsleyae]
MVLSPGKGEHDDMSAEVRSGRVTIQSESDGDYRGDNGRCLWAEASSSLCSPAFDLTCCRAQLERTGFQIPVEDFEIPLGKALDAPPVRRYLFFSSSISHFFIAVAVYVVMWCGLYSTVHLYFGFYLSDFWILCFAVTLLSVIVTSVIIFVLYHSNKQININTDVRLIQVNERLVRHGLLVGLADWVHHCVGVQQLFLVHWDLSPCLGALTETLEEMSFIRDEVQHKLNKKMSHLLLATKVTNLHEEDSSYTEEGADEERPLLVENEQGSGSTPITQREDIKLTKDYSLVPDCNLPIQETAYRLLLTYSAAYVRLMVSKRLPMSSQRPLSSRRAHCSNASLCLCQYVCKKVDIGRGHSRRE